MSKVLRAAQKLLKKKNSGPSGILAYMWANASKTVEAVSKDGETYTFSRPYVDPNSDAPLEPYFTILKTNRSGITVPTPPGGTQDSIFDVDGETQCAEFAKPEKQRDFMRDVLGLNFDEREMNDEIFVINLLDSPRVYNIKIESSFTAAARETMEEHGWDYQRAKEISTVEFEENFELLSKRSFVTDPPTPVNQTIFVVKVESFDGVVPTRTNKTETKIKSKWGDGFYEQGDFSTLGDLREQLKDAAASMWAMGDVPELVDHDYRAAVSRVEMVEAIHSRLKM